MVSYSLIYNRFGVLSIQILVYYSLFFNRFGVAINDLLTMK